MISETPDSTAETPDPTADPASGVLEAEGQKILTGLRDVELDVNSVDLLYNANPLILTRAQRAVVIETIRRERAKREEKRAARAARPAKVSKKTKEETSKMLEGINFLDLEP